MAHAVRTAISLPIEDFKLLETMRKKLDKSRSQVFREALRAWIRKIKTAELERRYVEGYRKKPENAKESAVWAKLAAEAFKAEGLR